MQQIRSSRRLESECQRNVEVMWLLHRLAPDHKSIAEFRRLHSEAVTQTGAELIRFARSVGLVRGEWVALDGSKFRAVSSVGSVREREALRRYLEDLESADAQEELMIEPSAVTQALEKLRQHPESEAHFMRTSGGVKVPAYNVQAAVDSEHALIVVQQVTTEATDNRSLLPMAEAAQAAVSSPGQLLHVVADAGYSNGEQAEACEARGIVPHVPANRGVNNQGGGKLFDRSAFTYQPEQDRFLCPAGQILKRQQISRKDRSVYYAGRPEVCGACPVKSRCTLGAQRMVSRNFHDEALQRIAATCYAGGNAATQIDGGTSICNLEVPHLRPSALSAARSQRSTSGDEHGGHGLKLETNDECPRPSSVVYSLRRCLNQLFRPYC